MPDSPARYQAIFLDRDGVINRERADYVKTWSEFQFLPGVLPALRRLATLPCPILVISNQSAVGRGLITAETLASIHRQLACDVMRSGGRIDGFYVCPHHPESGCDCRKPKPGLLRRAAVEHALDLRQCIFIGDAETDLQAAQAAGCDALLVQSGRQGAYLASKYVDRKDVCLVSDLATAVSVVLIRSGTPSAHAVVDNE